MLASFSKRVVSTSLRRFSSSCLPATVVDERVAAVVSSHKGVPEEFSEDSLFVSDLGLDRLQVRDLVMRLSEEFCVDVPFTAADQFVSARSAADFFKTHPKAR